MHNISSRLPACSALMQPSGADDYSRIKAYSPSYNVLLLCCSMSSTIWLHQAKNIAADREKLIITTYKWSV